VDARGRISSISATAKWCAPSIAGDELKFESEGRRRDPAARGGAVNGAAQRSSIYERNAREWWNPRSPAFRSLHAVNRFRVELVLDWLGTNLEGLIVVDFGCGGGLMTEPLARAGASVCGLDLSDASVRAASARIGARFVRGDALRAPLAGGRADLGAARRCVGARRRSRGRAARDARASCVPGGRGYDQHDQSHEDARPGSA
jgi:SAM-dependent methyltransferase